MKKVVFKGKMTSGLKILYLIKYRFYITCLLLLVLLTFHTINGQWVGDFWQHSAAVRELATHPFSPKHSQLLLDEPHVLYSPYSLAVALFAWITGTGVLTALSIAGILNLLLFLISLKLFVSLLFPEFSEGVSFYTLIFTLLLWGREKTPWDYSGFYHLRTLGYVLPYPSTFTISLVFLVLSLYVLFLKERNRILYLPIFGFSVIVLLSHPYSFIVLSIGLLAISMGTTHRFLNDMAALLALLLLTLIVASFWPYYPIIKLLAGESNKYHPGEVVMYQSVAKRIFPSLIGIPFLIWIMKSNKRHPIGLMFVLLSFVYAFGAFSKLWAYGRVISSIVLMLHISLAVGIARIEMRSLGNRSNAVLQKTLMSFLILMLIIPYSYKGLIRPVLARSVPGNQNTNYQYEWLSDYVGQYDVVLADVISSPMVPTFGGKVVAVGDPLPFVTDSQERIEDVNRFFYSATTLNERLSIAKKYGVSFLLIGKYNEKSWQEMKQSLLPFGHVVFENEEFVLISLKRYEVLSN